MRSKACRILALHVLLLPLWGVVTGCSQPDNPTPEKAPPPPAPKPEELNVGKKGADNKAYGTGDRYQKAMERLNKPGG
jgi:hypothetical protein